MQPDDEVYVGHMLDIVRKVVAKTERITREEFDRDENLRLAFAHLFQTIGEAARRVSRDLQAQHSEIPWAAIIGMRHKVVHDYMESTRTSFGEPPARKCHGSALSFISWSAADC